MCLNCFQRSTTVEQLLSENPECRFDAVVASEVIEHVDNPEFFVETCASLLNPGCSTNFEYIIFLIDF